MTWKRVATAAVLIPFVVGIVLWGSTALLALAVALVSLLALFEYFALGEAIGHRAYRFWTASCALLLIFVQWFATTWPSDSITEWEWRYRQAFKIFAGAPALPQTFFRFVLVMAPLTVSTSRRLFD